MSVFYRCIWRRWAEICEIPLPIHLRSVTNRFTGEPEQLFWRTHLRGLFRSSTFPSGSVTSQWAGLEGWDFQALSAYSCCFYPWTYAPHSTAEGGPVAPFGCRQKGAETHAGCPFFTRDSNRNK